MGEDYYTHRQSIKGGGQCSGEYLDFSNSSGTSIRPLFPKGHGGANSTPAKLSCAGAAIERNVCRHAHAAIQRVVVVRLLLLLLRMAGL